MYALECYGCGTTYDINDKRWKCDCGSFLNIKSDIKFEISLIDNKSSGLWRYRRFIPIFNNESVITYGEGYTPIVQEEVYDKKVYLKLDYMFPSGSYKDRGSTVLLSKIKELGIDNVVEDSSGNAGASVAMYSAKAGVKADIYVPESTSKGKLVQVEAFGANLVLVKGDREATTNAVMSAAKEKYYASHVWNPFFFEGTKTFIYEIFEQLGNKLPENIVMPVGNGTLLIGAYIACKELLKSGYIDKFPKFYCVQSENCAPLLEVLEGNGLEYSETIAEGIAIKKPLRLNQMAEIITETGGTVVTVSDSDVKSALKEIMKKGYFIEPTSASVIAALKDIDVRESTVVELTGVGLKATEKIGEIIKKH
ncbi:MAG: threonine synthase [Deferribacteraceae bacterium]|jgi:threonine synthase|nr:threonine synthase [Deferribacteraceae bacterium]